MMTEFKLPELGENITQGTVTKILVKSGDTVKKGQNILELETDKAVLEVPSNIEGIVGEILIKTGSVVKVGQAIFKLSDSSLPTGENVEKPQTLTRGHVQQEQQNVSPSTLRPTGVLGMRVPSDAGLKTKAPQGNNLTPNAPSGSITEITLPALGENIEKGTVTKILVKIGDTLKKGQNILEIETDKAVLEVPSSCEGLIKEILITPGTVIKVGQPIFKIEGGISTPNVNPVPQATSFETKITGSIETTTAVSSPVAPATFSPMPVRKDIPAAPSVRLLAREIGVDIGQVPGSGPGGRISINDVKAYCKMLNTSRPASGGIGAVSHPLPNFTKWGSVSRSAMSNVRKKTAEHLSLSWTSIPHVTQFDKVDITELEKIRKNFSNSNKKISVTPFIIKVVADALKKFPQFNSSIDMATQEIILKDYVNIGVAVDTDRGLLVPVLKNVDKMSTLQISDELTAMAERARLRKTTIEEMQGGGFTISNLGGIGGTCFTPIINWPEVAILGISRGSTEPVYTDGHFVPRLMLPLSLSYDHRVIDGADGARFIRWVCEAIQQPSLLDLNK